MSSGVAMLLGYTKLYPNTQTSVSSPCYCAIQSNLVFPGQDVARDLQVADAIASNASHHVRPATRGLDIPDPAPGTLTQGMLYRHVLPTTAVLTVVAP